MGERLTKADIQEKLLKEKKPFRLDDYAEDIGTGVNVVRRAIDQLQDEGYVFARVEDYFMRSKAKARGAVRDFSDRFDRHMKFGVISDSHLGSKKERLDALHGMYDIFKSEGVEEVFHAGDITEGGGVYRGQEFEVHKHGQQEQVDYVVKRYPRRKGIKTRFITGNHDLRQFERGGIDVGQPIGRRRRDLDYLGQVSSTVTLKGNTTMELLHPAGGMAYALSYKAQKDINNRQSKDLPDILVYGHYHTSYYMHYRGLDFVQAPCFKDAGNWEVSKGLNPTIGGWMVEATMTDDYDHIERFKPDLFVFE